MKNNIKGMYAPIFIIGVGRSGTSLLQSMLAAHPDIDFLPETQFLRNYCFSSRNKTKWESGGGRIFIQKLKRDSAFGRLKLAPEVCVTSESLKIEEVFKTIIEVRLTKSGKKIPGDKDPRNLDYIEAIHRYFPQAYILHIIRDPRDVVLSRTKADWSKKWPFFLHACMYQTQLKRGRKLGRDLFKKNYKELFYEDLINDAEHILNDVCNWIGCSFDDHMLYYQEVAQSLVSEQEMQWKKETLGPLLKKNKNKWKQAFNAYEVAIIEKICEPVWRELPYNKAKHERLSVWQWMKIKSYVLISKLFDLLYPLRIKFL